MFGTDGLDFTMFVASLGMFMLESTNLARTHNGPIRIWRFGDFVWAARSQNASYREGFTDSTRPSFKALSKFPGPSRSLPGRLPGSSAGPSRKASRKIGRTFPEGFPEARLDLPGRLPGRSAGPSRKASQKDHFMKKLHIS